MSPRPGFPITHTSSHRSLSEALRAVRSREEQETLLGDGDEEIADPDGCLRAYAGPQQVFVPDPHAGLPVYVSIHRIRRIVLASIDDPYTVDQLKEPRMNVLIVKPLVDRLYDPDDVSIVYCLLVNRVQFLREQSYQHHHQSVNVTRANLCELLAMKLLRRYDEDVTGRPGLLLLANILVAGFDPFQNAPHEVCEEVPFARMSLISRGGYEGKSNALEISIISESKMFLSSTACQKVVDAVYYGRIVYTPNAFIDIIPDHYKHKPISLYDPRKAPLLNQYRLIVPRSRNIIEICQFAILLLLYCLCMAHRDHTRFTGYEVCFVVYAAGWVLDEFASMLEHGWHVHTQNLWSFLDITFVVVYVIYLGMRLHGWTVGNMGECRQALDILAIAAPILLPRLAFNLMPESMLFISLRAMMADFTALSLIAVWCFGGFLLAMKWLSMGNTSVDPEDAPNSITISKWMLWIWFGLDGTGIQESPTFHLILGPALMTTYAFLGNTLFLTILVAILSNTFSKIAADATAEIQFRRTVLTFEGVKSDAIFAYRPPFNILALVILVPLKFLISPRWFHKVNVFAVRVLNAPILVLIGLYERRYLWKSKKMGQNGPLKKGKESWWSLSSFNVHADIQAVFESEPPQSVVDRIEEEDEIEDAILENSFAAAREASPATQVRRRRFSSVWQG
ncbi:uncharacterized protein BDZ99DRAFT_566953 [Mytilinidion resinicola]|uniref:Nonselective cation channel n=1 Tax=Mytilinidion resinicola TaxID=574789 RepID=A0A6A6Z1S3_9PEZI|nr:uncharacterized protein BDZ99DRAFT_566953 [Mytilinidion resinicola]KAF2815051.1 hypothetical protein BDZ99DRAFT_566953 [Mytilinidion resinicola]